MAWNRYWLAAFAALVLTQTGRSQAFDPPGFDRERIPSPAPGAAANLTCKVYALAELGDDPKLCKWIAETIPDMIESASWKESGAKLSYYAPAQILVINNTQAVHGQVEEFLQNLRKTIARKPAARHDNQVMPAQFTQQDPARPISVVQTGPAGYPVPAAPVGPKHLFHFIIRYEGEGIIDSNVAAFTKALMQDKTDAATASYRFPPTQLAAPAMKPERMAVIPASPAAPPMPPAAPPMPPADAPSTGWRAP